MFPEITQSTFVADQFPRFSVSSIFGRTLLLQGVAKSVTLWCAKMWVQRSVWLSVEPPPKHDFWAAHTILNSFLFIFLFLALFVFSQLPLQFFSVLHFGHFWTCHAILSTFLILEEQEQYWSQNSLEFSMALIRWYRLPFWLVWLLYSADVWSVRMNHRLVTLSRSPLLPLKIRDLMTSISSGKLGLSPVEKAGSDSNS